MNAVSTPRGGTTPAAESPHTAAGVTPDPVCGWCGDLGLVLVADLTGGRADWSRSLLVLCVCARIGRAA
jgi:hypothetical protein